MLRIPLAMAALALAAPALAQTAADPATAAPAKPNVTAGAQVVDSSGAMVGTIESVTNGVATLSTGTTRAGIPIGSFAQGDGKLVLGLTKAQVDAQGAPIGAPATAGAATSAASATAPVAAIAIGTPVKDQTGAAVGTVKAVNGDMVTVASATASAQLPKKSFAQSGDSLVIGLTAAQFESAAKAAGGAKKG